MDEFHVAPAVVVGVDGSTAATRAAVWAVDEAVSRDIPLRLVYVIDPADPCCANGERTQSQFASARAALYDGQRAVEATGAPVKIETEIRCGPPLATLIAASKSAAIFCVGSLGLKHSCSGTRHVGAALAGLARCPVAVIGPPSGRQPADTGWIVAEVCDSPDNSVVLGCAFAEATLRKAPLKVITSLRSPSGVRQVDDADGNRSVQAHLNRRIAYWTRRYPDLDVESIAVHGRVRRYLSTNAKSIRLFVTDARGQRDLSGRGLDDCPVLSVQSSHL